MLLCQRIGSKKEPLQLGLGAFHGAISFHHGTIIATEGRQKLLYLTPKASPSVAIETSMVQIG